MLGRYTDLSAIKSMIDDGAIRVFPSSADESVGDQYTSAEWNNDILWKEAYSNIAIKGEIFAESAFGIQFTLQDDGKIGMFTPDINTYDIVSSSMKEFASAILRSSGRPLQYDLYKSAVKKHGLIKNTQHYTFAKPLSLEGKMEIDNVIVSDSVQNMRSMGRIAKELGYCDSDEDYSDIDDYIGQL